MITTRLNLTKNRLASTESIPNTLLYNFIGKTNIIKLVKNTGIILKVSLAIL